MVEERGWTVDSWPLWGQWVLLILVGGMFLGCCWWLALARARASGDRPVTLREKMRTAVGALSLADRVVIALLAVFLVPLAVRTGLALI